MISWILAAVLIIWIIIQRRKPEGKIEGYPLGMPRGTVRAMIAIIIISFPFTFLIRGEEIPGLVTNAVFLIVAFYFEARKGSEEKIPAIIKEIMHPEKYEQEKREKIYPLYLPKYSVRISLIIILGLVLIFDAFGPQVPFEATNTLADLFLLIVLFMIGSLFRAQSNAKERKRIHSVILDMDNLQELSKYEVLQKLMDQKDSWWSRKWKSFVSIITLLAVMLALLFYTIDFGLILYTIPFLDYDLTLRGTLLLIVSVYYGLRD